MYVGRTYDAYSRTVAELWQDSGGHSLLLVEHDIGLTERAIRQARHCRCKWGISPYPARVERRDLLRCSLGFTRFSRRLMAEYPEAVDEANAIDDSGSICPPGHWKLFDARLYSRLRTRYSPHLHDEVPHYHAE